VRICTEHACITPLLCIHAHHICSPLHTLSALHCASHPDHAFTCLHMPSHAFTCLHMPSHAFTDACLHDHAFTCLHDHAFTCLHAHAFTCPSPIMPSHVFTDHAFTDHAFTCLHRSCLHRSCFTDHAFTCLHMPSHLHSIVQHTPAKPCASPSLTFSIAFYIFSIVCRFAVLTSCKPKSLPIGHDPNNTDTHTRNQKNDEHEHSRCGQAGLVTDHNKGKL
jgi:hypothetical protein